MDELEKQATGAPRVPERFLDGTASMQELLTFLQSIDPKNIPMGDYMRLTDWVGKLADALNIPE